MGSAMSDYVERNLPLLPGAGEPKPEPTPAAAAFREQWEADYAARQKAEPEPCPARLSTESGHVIDCEVRHRNEHNLLHRARYRFLTPGRPAIERTLAVITWSDD